MLQPLNFLKSISDKSVPVLDLDIPLRRYTPINLSVNNVELEQVSLSDPEQCQAYIDRILQIENAVVAYGGYLEKRNLYADNPNFSSGVKSLRNIHLGIDFWSMAGTKVIVPADGTVHSFKNNAVKGDYGPTIVLKHEVKEFHFHSLYGHLSIESLEDLYKGKKLERGAVLGTLGTAEINVNYAPHLHFQLIIDMEDKNGDYPGVCSDEDLEFYTKNCPDPNLLLHMP